MCGIDFSNNEAGIVPGRSGEGCEETQHDDYKHLRVDDIEKEDGGSGCQKTEG